jgi:hypothetical protein
MVLLFIVFVCRTYITDVPTAVYKISDDDDDDDSAVYFIKALGW